MKKWVFLFALVYALSFVSSYYACEGNSTYSTDVREIVEGKIKVINGIVLGLGDANEVTAIKRLEADVFIDAQATELTDNNSKTIEFMDESKYNISLELANTSYVQVKINSEAGTIGIGEVGTISGFDVLIFSSEGVYPGTASVDVVIGRDFISLSNKDNPGDIVTAEGKKFSIEIFSASDDDASIRVGRCANGSGTIIEIADPIIPVQNNSTVNNTNSTLNNNSVSNDSVIANSSANQSNSSGQNQSGVIEKAEDNQRDTIIYIILAGVFILAVITLIVLIGRSRKVEVKTPSQN